MKALIHAGMVRQIVEDGEEFPVHPKLTWVDCGAEVKTGYSYDGDQFTAPTVEPEPEQPTTDELYDRGMRNNKIIKALVLCINDGSIVPGANATPAQLKAAIKGKME